MEYTFEDVNEAFPIMWHRMMSDDGVIVRNSRNGPMRESRSPVTTTFTRPWHRALLLPVRDCNPIFHVIEAMWMLAGRNDVAPLAKINPRMMEYSDNRLTLVSAYGYRWDTMLLESAKRLRADNDSRRTYIPIFWPQDSSETGKDVPCNTGIAFYIRNGQLDMTVFNRSNDMVWGAYGANYVHFGFLQEYMAALVGAHVGHYSQISSCFHVYPEFDVSKRLMRRVPTTPEDYYMTRKLDRLLPVLEVTSAVQMEAMHYGFQSQVNGMFDYIMSDRWEKHGQEPYLDHPFLREVAWPMYKGWSSWKNGKYINEATAYFNRIASDDWRFACKQWLAIRAGKLAAAATIPD